MTNNYFEELNFPEYATLSQADVSHQDMGEKTITAQVKIDGEITPEFSYDWAVTFQGEKYIMPLRTPQAAREGLDATYELTFQHWAVYQLKRWMFFTVPSTSSGTAIADKYIASVSLNITDFCDLFAQVLRYYYGDTITILLNPNPGKIFSDEAVVIDISYSYVWDVLIQLYDLYGERWYISPADNNDNKTEGGERYVIYVGFDAPEISHIFKQGFEGGLLKVERQVQDENIRNMLLGRGGDKNLPLRYFKDHDDDNDSFVPDPDWIPELESIYFDALRGATFRSYIQGWKAAHYPHELITTPTASRAYAPWAWKRGATDVKFNPVEFVADEYSINNNGHEVIADSSIAKYGELLAGLDNNDDIYPTIQGTGYDIAIDIEHITSDDVPASTESDAQVRTLPALKTTIQSIPASSNASQTLRGTFTVKAGKTGNLIFTPKVLSSHSKIVLKGSIIRVFDSSGKQISASGIPEGNYTYDVTVTLENTDEKNAATRVTVGDETPDLEQATIQPKWNNTFDIWVKNIWETAKEAGETDAQYAERVWNPILGDRAGNEAKVVFYTGLLALSEDYEFTIVPGGIHYDTSRSFDGEDSHWRITLAKSEAELEATGLYLPSTKQQGAPGDKFFFIGIDMPHLYVTKAEERLDDWKKDQLREVADIKPVWIVTPDRVRLSNEGLPDALIDQLSAGAALTLYDEHFIPGSHQEKLYIQSITYKFREPSSSDAALNPDVEIVLSDKYETVANPVDTIQGEVSALSKQVGSIANVERIMRLVGDKLYLRKDGFPDRSMSPTEFASLLTSGGFRSGLVGGTGWGFFQDESKNWILEVDRINVRQEMQVNNLVINQISARGGMIIESAAAMEITRVVPRTNGYLCYFDQKNGSVANLFKGGDIALCHQCAPDALSSDFSAALKYYRRRVDGVGVDYVLLSDTYCHGSGIPQVGDVIVQYGNDRDLDRQFVIVRDVWGGGYERFLDGLDSVDATGTEYYFVGRQTGMYEGRPRFFLGDVNNFIEYIDGELKLKCDLDIQSTFGSHLLSDYIRGEVESVASPSYLIDLTDELIALPATADGTLETGALPVTTAVRVFKGAELDSGWTFSVGLSSDWTAIVGHNTENTIGAIRILKLSDTKNTFSIPVYAKKDDLTIEATLTIIKVVPGAQGFGTATNVVRDNLTDAEWELYGTTGHAQTWADTASIRNNCRVDDQFTVSGTSTDGGKAHTIIYRSTSASGDLAGVCIGHTVSERGQAATVYSLLPSVDNITRNVDGVLSATSITCTKYKTTGDDMMKQTDEFYLYAKVYSDNGTATWQLIAAPGVVSGTVNIGATTTAVLFEYRFSTNATDLLDRERVPVISDASDLEIGGTNLLRNSDFLDGTSMWLSSWGAEQTSINDILTLDGRRSIQLAASGLTSDMWYTFLQNATLDDAPLDTTRPFILSFFATTLDTATVPYIGVKFLDATGEEITSKMSSYSGMLTAGQFKFFSQMHYAPVGTVTVQVRFQIVRNGSLIINAPKLERGNKATAWSINPADGGYLRQALLQDTSMSGGLILASLIKTGYTDSSGNRITQSGLNGIYDESKPGGGIAIWGGGDEQDAEEEPMPGKRTATMLFRHDGTGYASKNVIKFEEDKIRVSNGVVMDERGFALYDSSNNERLRISDVAVGSFESYKEPAQTALPTGLSTSATIRITYGDDGFKIEGLGTKSASLGTLLAGYKISASVILTFSASFSYPEDTTSVIYYCPSLIVSISKDGTEVFSVEQKITPVTGSFMVPVSVNYLLDSDGVYSMKISIYNPHTPALNQAKLQTGASITCTGNVIKRSESSTLLCRNGLASIWGTSLLLIDEDAVIMRHGPYALRISDNGFEKVTDGSNNWKPANI